ncbi:MAG: ankyrin repeat domain-containing protein [Verrucomicrobiota bacterium]
MITPATQIDLLLVDHCEEIEFVSIEERKLNWNTLREYAAADAARKWEMVLRLHHSFGFGRGVLVFTTDNNGWTPLHWAAYEGHMDLAELMLNNKAEVDANNKNGDTPLNRAAAKGHKSVAELLLAHKAEVNAKNYAGWTPLHEAAFEGHKETTELLLGSKADVNARNNMGQTPMHLATLKGHKDVAELLSQHGGHESIACKSANMGAPKH